MKKDKAKDDIDSRMPFVISKVTPASICQCVVTCVCERVPEKIPRRCRHTDNRICLWKGELKIRAKRMTFIFILLVSVLFERLTETHMCIIFFN